MLHMLTVFPLTVKIVWRMQHKWKVCEDITINIHCSLPNANIRKCMIWALCSSFNIDIMLVLAFSFMYKNLFDYYFSHHEYNFLA